MGNNQSSSNQCQSLGSWDSCNGGSLSLYSDNTSSEVTFGEQTPQASLGESVAVPTTSTPTLNLGF